MFRGIRAKLFLLFMAMMAAMIALTLIFNYVMLPKFTLYRKETTLKESYIEVIGILNTYPQISVSRELATIESRNSVRIILGTADGNIIYGADNTYTFSEGTPISASPGFNESDDFPYIHTCYNTNKELRLDKKTGLSYISYLGACFVNNSSLYIVTVDSTIQSINDSAKVSTDFAMLTALITALFGGIVFYFAAQQFVKPVVSINDAAKRMAHFDFKSKIAVTSRDEVGELAVSINNLSDELERTISSLRTANRQLQLDIINRDKTDRMRREFISNVSHELKTPISLIMGYAEGLKVGINEDDKDFYCDVISDEAQNMNKLVSRLLYISQIDSGAMQPETSCFELAAVINNVLENHTLQCENQGITVMRDFEYDGTVNADLDQIRQVVTNYVSNAVHHCCGEMRIIVSTATVGEGRVRCSVFNTGDHIPDESLAHVWESFYKVDKARTREYGGTGLGLYIVSRIIQNHGGAYGVDNVDGGVTFWFEINI